MGNIADSFSRLCQSYVTLADRFQQLDVEHMTLKTKVIPLLKALKSYKRLIETLKQENQDLAAQLETMTAKYDALKPFEDLLGSDLQALLSEAEEQVELVEQTLSEMENNNDPDLTEEDKALLRVFYEHPQEFEMMVSEPSPYPTLGINGHHSSGMVDSVPVPDFQGQV
ncbi:MAG: hypothetical protein VKK04_26805 [Synechococcales bacterium]|nr:hypothetical protein [Synechococcales bacterium]